MDQSASQPFMPDYGLSHDLLNDLMMIVGECDLLNEEFLEHRFSQHLQLIRATAVRMSKRIAEHQILAARNSH